MPTRSLQVVITGDSRQLGVASRQADAHLTFVEKSAHRMGMAVKAGFGVAAIGAGIGVKFLKDSVQAAERAETSQKRLEAQLKASGVSYRAHAKQIDEVIQKHSKLAAVDDEDLQDAFTNLVRLTGHVNGSLKEMGLVTDIARGKNISLTAAATLLGKVHAGNTALLKRFGIAIQPVTAAQDKLRESTKHATVEQVRAAKAADTTKTSQRALAELQKRFGGQAEAYGKTAAGAQDRFRVAVENLQEKIGKALLPTITKVTNAVAKFVDQMTTGRGAGGRFARAMGDVDDALRPIVRTGGQVISFLVRHKNVMRAARDATMPFINAIHLVEQGLNAVKTAADKVAGAVRAVGHAFSAIGGAVKGVAGSLNPFGDGVGKLGSLSLPSIGGFSGGLHGANPALGGVASLAGKFGLSISAGRTDHSRTTTSGNVSYHSSGEALDFSNGVNTPAERGFQKFVHDRFGGRVAELIGPVPSLNLKDGSPYPYSGSIQAQHKNHVHVALDLGRPGVGIGDGLGKGDGIGQAVQAARAAGFRGEALVDAVAIAGAESGFIANRQNLKYPDHSIGMWQINQLAHHGRYGSDSALTDPFTNARAAWAISGHGRSFGPWSTWPSAAGSWLARARAAVAGVGGSSGSGGSGGGSKPRFVSHPGSSDFAVEEHAAAVRNARRRAGARTGPAKGLTPKQLAQSADAGTSGDTGDPNQPLIDALAADAAARQALADQLAENTAQMKRQTDFAEAVANTSNFQLSKGLADIVSGRIVGYGVAGRSFTPGTGVDYAY